MVGIRKRDGDMEEFDRDKLELSMLRAKVSAKDVLKVAEYITTRVQDGTPTVHIREQVIATLKNLDQAAALRYETFRPIFA